VSSSKGGGVQAILQRERGRRLRAPDQGEVDDAVVAAARRGEASAFVSILRHYDRRMRIVASRLLRDRDAMDDVLQEAALKALRGLPAFRGDAPLGAWLCRIVTTTCLDHMRRTGKEFALAPEEFPETFSVVDLAAGMDARQRLATALATLAPEQRLAVLLIDQFGYSFSEAASALGVPLGTVASRVATARSWLRKALVAREEER
jgi:RNA polymerase sigma-70 factor, ECF subfamily